MVSDAPGPDVLADLAGPGWADAFPRVPREHFIPDTAWASPMGPESGYWIDRDADPDRWRAAVYSDSVIVTQVEEGAADLTEESVARGRFTSSSSAPSNVDAFLDLLDPSPDDRVLEVGTGTGWTAALLCARVGDGNVVTVEVDAEVAKQAAVNLERAGYAPRVVVGDGADGVPGSAPFDRVHATCGVHTIPPAWVEQTRPGGVIVAPWMPGYGGHMVALTVTGDGRAVGRFFGDCGYMMLRAQRGVPAPLASDERESVSVVDPRRIARAGAGFQVAVAGMMPRLTAAGGEAGDGAFLLVLSDGQGSHALARRDPDSGRTAVTQRGARNLWDEAEAAFTRWMEWGEPGRERFGLAVDGTGQHVWLDRVDPRVEGAHR